MSVSHRDVVKLYRALLRHTRRLGDSTQRESTIEQIRQEFGKYKHESDKQVVKSVYYDALNKLNQIRTQATIEEMIGTEAVSGTRR